MSFQADAFQNDAFQVVGAHARLGFLVCSSISITLAVEGGPNIGVAVEGDPSIAQCGETTPITVH